MLKVKEFFGKDIPKTLCVCLPLPGLSDENILPVFEVMNTPEEVFSTFFERFKNTYSWESEARWELIEAELTTNKNSFFQGIIIAYYKPVEASNDYVKPLSI